MSQRVAESAAVVAWHVSAGEAAHETGWGGGRLSHLPSTPATRLALPGAIAGHALLIAVLLWVGTQAKPMLSEPSAAVEMMFSPATTAEAEMAAPDSAGSTNPVVIDAVPMQDVAAAVPVAPETELLAGPPPAAPSPPITEAPSLTRLVPDPAPVVPFVAIPPPVGVALPVPPTPVQRRRPPVSPPRSHVMPQPHLAQSAPGSDLAAGSYSGAPPATAKPNSAPAVPTVPATRAGIDPAWRTTLNEWLASRRRYPEIARQREVEGVVGVTFTVEHDGRVSDMAITHPSGSTLLDDAVRDMLRGQRVPPFPETMPQGQASVTANVRYSLTR